MKRCSDRFGVFLNVARSEGGAIEVAQSSHSKMKALLFQSASLPLPKHTPCKGPGILFARFKNEF